MPHLSQCSIQPSNKSHTLLTVSICCLSYFIFTARRSTIPFLFKQVSATPFLICSIIYQTWKYRRAGLNHALIDGSEKLLLLLEIIPSILCLSLYPSTFTALCYCIFNHLPQCTVLKHMIYYMAGNRFGKIFNKLIVYYISILFSTVFDILFLDRD